MNPSKSLPVVLCLFFFLSSCNWGDFTFGLLGGDDSDNDQVADIEGSPSSGAEDIYESANLNDLCDDDECTPSYDSLPGGFIFTDGQDPLDEDVCNFDYNPNLTSAFVLNRVDGEVNGLELWLSREDLFFIAWVSIRMQINPYFLLGVLSQESAGNCAAVSSSNAEGCFQITNTFGRAQLDDSYEERVEEWHWSDRSGEYYPDDIFIDPETYFEEAPPTDQFRITLDPTAGTIEGEEVSSVVNFTNGAIASGLYYKWQEYLLYYSYEDLRDTAEELFESEDGKSLWQASAYNGGAYGAVNALLAGGEDFLDELSDETQNYAEMVVAYCKEYQGGTSTYSDSYTEDDVEWIIDLLSYTYPDDYDIDWEEVKDDVHQVFFADGTTELTFVDDVKALVYVISTFVPDLAPEWPDEGSI